MTEAHLALAAEPAGGTPDVVFIVADGVGYEGGGSAGAKRASTPNIDALAKGGADFSNGYASSSVSGPSLAGILTGRYPQRFGFEVNAEGDAASADRGPRGLDASQVTVAERLKSAGYVTGLIGAWNLGTAQGLEPTKRGFDEFYGLLSDHAGADGPAVYRGTAKVEKPQNSIEQFGAEASAFIEHHSKDPFFLYLPITQASGWGGATTQPAGAAAYLAEIDDLVGRVVAELHERGLEDNTLIAFVSDDGGSVGNQRLKGTSWTLWEGGIRVPFVISWKGKIAPAQVQEPVIGLDLAPTALAAAGVTPEADWHLDGANLLPLLEGQSTAAPHDALYWRLGPQYAVRLGNWKLVKAHDSGRPEFFYLQDDAVEANDLFVQQSARVKSAQASWDAWNASNETPRWEDKRWNGESSEGKAVSVAAADTGSDSRSSGPFAAGDSLRRNQAPFIAEKALDITAEIEPAGDNGVVVAQGGAAQGYAIYLTEGKLAFAVREAGDLVTIVSKDPLGKGHFNVEATLGAGGALALSVDGKRVAEGKATGLIPRQPMGGFNVGDNGQGAVGDYEVHNPFDGKITNVRVQTSGLN